MLTITTRDRVKITKVTRVKKIPALGEHCSKDGKNCFFRTKDNNCRVTQYQTIWNTKDGDVSCEGSIFISTGTALKIDFRV